jgi:hypothetical protein
LSLKNWYMQPCLLTCGSCQESAAEDDYNSTFSAIAHGMLSLPALPACLMPVFSKLVAVPPPMSWASGGSRCSSAYNYRGLLLSVLGDLDAVWADEAATKVMIELPPTAFAMLLGCDELKVSKNSCQSLVPSHCGSGRLCSADRSCTLSSRCVNCWAAVSDRLAVLWPRLPKPSNPKPSAAVPVSMHAAAVCGTSLC